MGTDKNSTSNADHELTTDLAHALYQTLPRQIGDHRIDRARIVASRLVAHLRLCRWQFYRDAPTEMHGSFTKGNDEQ